MIVDCNAGRLGGIAAPTSRSAHNLQGVVVFQTAFSSNKNLFLAALYDRLVHRIAQSFSMRKRRQALQKVQYIVLFVQKLEVASKKRPTQIEVGRQMSANAVC
jgi:hypothetical protein